MERLPAYDCHCHILPGLDDGAQTLEEAVFLAGKLASYGFERAVCTSHSTRLYRNTPSTVIPACERLQEALVQAGIRLELVPSLEYRLLPETWPEIREKGWLLPWEGNHILMRWHDAGAAFQRNLASLEGFYGPAPAARARHLLDLNLYSFLGTDTHSRKYTDAFDALLISSPEPFSWKAL